MPDPLKKIYIFDYDGTLTRTAGRETIDFFQNNPMKKRDPSLLTNEEKDLYLVPDFLIEKLKSAIKDSDSHIIIASSNNQLHINNTLLQSGLTDDELSKISIIGSVQGAYKANAALEELDSKKFNGELDYNKDTKFFIAEDDKKNLDMINETLNKKEHKVWGSVDLSKNPKLKDNLFSNLKNFQADKPYVEVKLETRVRSQAFSQPKPQPFGDEKPSKFHSNIQTQSELKKALKEFQKERSTTKEPESPNIGPKNN